MEVVQNNENPEVVTPEQTQQTPPPAPAETRQERNWKAMKAKQDDLERELRLKSEMLERMMVQPQKQEPDELDSVSDAEFLDKGKVSKLVEKRAQKIAEEVVKRETERLRIEQHNATFMDKLRYKHSDYDEIVTSETMALLEEQEPELVEMMVSSKDPYKIGLQAYKYIKSSGIVDKVPGLRRTKEVEKKIEENNKTVQTPMAHDKRPIVQALKMTKDMQTNLYKEMMEYASHSGYSY